MKQISATIYFIIFLVFFAEGQTYWIKRNPFLDTLFNSKEVISQISSTELNHFLPVYFKKDQTNQTIVKNKKGLFILIEGTGQVYKASDTTNDQIAFKRIDSTIFSGNNFSSLVFSKKDTLYSFGGYGYWHLNGQLRFFNEGFEWNVKKISKEFSTDMNYSYYDARDSKIYYVASKFGEDVAFKELNDNHEIIELDLKTYENKVLGIATKEFTKLNKPGNFLYLPSLNGIIIKSANDLLLLNYKDNAIYKLTNENIKNEFRKNSNEKYGNFFEKNGKIYFTNYPEYEVRTIPININDFTLEPYGIYDPISEVNYFFLTVVSIFLGVIAVVIFILVKKRKSYKSKIELQTPIIEPIEIYENEFTTIENRLIELIIASNLNARQITIDQINNSLGISKKSIEVQKKVRGDAINRINHKFKLLFNKEVLFIERYRSDSDRRSYNYVINKENVALFKSKYTSKK